MIVRHLPLLALAACGPRWPIHPDQASLVSDDIPRYWRAVDAGATPEHFQRYYLDPGTDGLHALRRARWRRAEPLAEAFATHEAWYRAGRARSLSLTEDGAWRDAIAEVYRRAESNWPDAEFPTVTLAFGDFNTGGTHTGAGLVIGVELYLDGPDAPREGLGDWHRAVVRTTEEIPAIVAHEHAHAMQADVCVNPRATLLEKALQEGVADFVARAHAGFTGNDHLEAWARPRERALWSTFQASMHGREYGPWLYGGGTTDDQPADVGYWIGEQIAAAWWERHGGATAAWGEILAAHCDATRFLEASGYGK